MNFVYRALKDDKVVTGKIEAKTQDEALFLLKAGGYFPIEVKKDGSQSELMQMLDRVSFLDIVNFTRQLAIMMNAGVTLMDAFDIFKKQTTKKPMLKLLSSLDKDIRSGVPFSQALSKYPQYFNRLFIALVKAGEASGKLSAILLNIADNLEKQRALKGKVKGAMLYPSLVMMGMFAVVFILITFVIPELIGMYEDLNVELPMTTQIIVALSSFSQRFWPLIIVGLGLIAGMIFAFTRSKDGKILLDKYVLKMPLVKSIIIQSMLVDTTRALSVLIGSGVSILDTLDIITESHSNVVFQKAFADVRLKVEKGVSLGNALQENELFPPLIVQMAIVGEQTGHLDETMERISLYFELETEGVIKTATTLIEPMTLVVLGIVVGFMVFSVITPIYSLTSQI